MPVANDSDHAAKQPAASAKPSGGSGGRKAPPHASDGRFGTKRTLPPKKAKAAPKGKAKGRGKAKAAPKGKAKGRGKAKAGDGKTPQERANQNAAQVSGSLGMKDLEGPMVRVAAGMDTATLEHDAHDNLIARGLAQRAPDGTVTLTAAGNKFLAAARKGDQDAASGALTAGKAAVAIKADRDKQRADRQAARDAKAKERQAKADAKAKERAAKTKKAQGMGNWTGYTTITKVDAEQRIVEGIASTESLDSQREIVALDALKAALPDYLEWANIREMHQPSAVGTALKAEVIDGALHLAAHIVDDAAWAKVVSGVYKGFSIGGRVRDGGATMSKGADGRSVRTITALDLHEISLVDRPANPDAKIALWKGDGMDPTEVAEGEPIAKAADPQKAVALLQQLRNEAELTGDVDEAQHYTDAIKLVLQASGDVAADDTEDEPADDTSTDPAAADPTADPTVQMSQAITTLRKAGRAFSTANTSAMHGTIKALAGMLASAGDPVAQQVVACYGDDTAPADAAPAADAPLTLKAVDVGAAVSDGISKALAPQLDALTKALESMQARVDHLEKQPAPGGPVLRSVEKAVTGQDAPARVVKAVVDTSDVAELSRLAQTEPNPLLRAQYLQRLRKAQEAK